MVWGVMFCSVVVLMNLLIAMMSETYENVSEEAQLVFRCERSRLFSSYASAYHVPPPLNLIAFPFRFAAFLGAFLFGIRTGDAPRRRDRGGGGGAGANREEAVVAGGGGSNVRVKPMSP